MEKITISKAELLQRLEAAKESKTKKGKSEFSAGWDCGEIQLIQDILKGEL